MPQEIGDIQRGSDLCTSRTKEPRATNTHRFPAIAVACKDIDVRNVRAIILGPHETPYEFGFFEVSLRGRKPATIAC